MAEDEMDYWEGCKELAKIVIENGDPEMSAYKIQVFCEALHEGETPRMSLTMARKTMELDDITLRLPSEIDD